MKTRIETIPCPANCDDGYVPIKYETCDRFCRRCEGRGTVEKHTIVDPDPEDET
jgi:hypothetical protein